MHSVLPEQKCPLCKQNAKYCGVDFDRKKYFKCPNCKNFVISKNHEEFVAGLKQEIREFLSKQSSTLENDFALLIYLTPDTSELKTEKWAKDRWI